MNRSILWLIVIFVVIGCSASTENVSPPAHEQAALNWLAAATNGDGGEMLRLTCLDYRDEVRLSSQVDAGVGLGLQLLAHILSYGLLNIDPSASSANIEEVKITTINKTDVSARLHVEGEIFYTVLGAGEVLGINNTFLMKFERDGWRWCGAEVERGSAGQPVDTSSDNIESNNGSNNQATATTDTQQDELELQAEDVQQDELELQVEDKIVFSSNKGGASNLYVINVDGSGMALLTDNNSSSIFYFSPVWSPNRTKIAYNCTGDICVMNADGSDSVNLTNGNFDQSNGSPDWSPDGTKIVFGCLTDICVMNADGSNMTFLVQDSFHNSDPIWSPDGTKIAFRSDRRDNADTDIYIMNSDGTDISFLVGEPNLQDQNISWSPDGAKIAYASPLYGWEIFTVSPNGQNKHRLTNTPFAETDISWSPDGTKFVTDCRPEEGINALCILDADGTNYRQLVMSSEFYFGTPDW